MRILVLGAGKMGSFFLDLLSFDHEMAVYEKDPRRMRFTYNTQRFTTAEEIDAFQPELVINAVTVKYTIPAFNEVLPQILEEGVPECDIIHEDKSLNTKEQAVEVIKLAQQRGWKKLILVASHEHQYRAYLTFLREVLDTHSGITLYNAPVRNLNWFEDKGWGKRIDRLEAEILRIEKYTALGHLANAQEVIQYQQWKEQNLPE